MTSRPGAPQFQSHDSVRLCNREKRQSNMFSPQSTSAPQLFETKQGGQREDARQKWILGVIYDYFRGSVKVDKLNKFLSSDECLGLVREFTDAPDERFLVLQENGPTVNVSNKPPKTVKGRMMYFLKTKSQALPGQGYERMVLVGDLTEDSLLHLNNVAQYVYMPLLSNPNNQRSWSEMVTKDVMDNLHTFLADIQIEIGRTEGQTILPLPADEDLAERPITTHKERIHILEGCLITWTKQIKKVLRRDPEDLLKSNENPGPLAELEFWTDKSRDLDSIFEQLQGLKVRKLLKFLDSAKSTYNMPFAKLCKEVFQARTEAIDNVMFLNPLRIWFEKNRDASFSRLPEVFRPMMHLLLLVWKNSRFYNTPARLVVMMREICNSLISKATGYINGKTVFEMIENEEANRAVSMLKTTLRVCGNFKSAYFDYKAKANSECPTNPWRIQNNALFVRLDAFLERCHDTLDLTETIVQFIKLGKLEVGGTKGKTLSTSVGQIYSDFEKAVDGFRAVPYDIMDVDAKSFDDDFYEFRVHIKELERRLASVLSQSFDDCATIIGKFKLLDSMEGLLIRPILADELEKKHSTLIGQYNDDLREMQQLFIDAKDSPPIPSNMPKISGALQWCRGLLDRIKLPMEKLKDLDRSVLDREEAKEVVKTYTSLVASLGEYEHLKIEEWGEEIEQSSQAKLKLPLLRRKDNSQELVVNFDPKLVELLREVKYFLLLGLSVPSSALNIYKKAEIFRRQTGNLELIVNMYNNVLTGLLPVEAPLMKGDLDKIDKALQQGVKNINWKSHGIDYFLTECMGSARNLDTMLTVMKGSLKRIDELLVEWKMEPLFQRRSKPVNCEENEAAFRQGLHLRCKVISQGGKEIHGLLKDMNKKLKVSPGLPDWKSYQDFINNVIIAGLSEVVEASLKYLNAQLDAEVIKQEDKLPLLEIDMELYGKEVVFVPGVGPGVEGAVGNSGGVRTIINGWVEGFLGITRLFKRYDSLEGTFGKELLDNPFIQILIGTLNENLLVNEEKCADQRQLYVEFEYLWCTDLTKYFSEFLEGAWLENTDDNGNVVGKRRINLDKFDEEIKRFRNVQTDIAALPSSVDIDYLRINCQPIQQAMSTWVTKWVYMFTSYLQQHLVDKLTSIKEFMDRIYDGLNEPIRSADQDSLMAAMTHIRDVRKAMTETTESFGPMRECMALMRSHGMDLTTVLIGTPELEDETGAVELLEALPMLWDKTVNLAFKKKEEIQPIQNSMAEVISQDITKFAQRVERFRSTFRGTAPFAYNGPSTEAYKLIDSQEKNLRALESEVIEFHNLEELFEMAESSYVAVTSSREEIVLLKCAWDMTALVDSKFDKWSGTLWLEIAAERLLDETTLLDKQVAKLPREMRNWGVFKNLADRVKNMAVVIPLISELHSEAMQDRHWKAIMTLTHTHFDKGSNFCLANVLDLKLHAHVDDVLEIIEVATKERKIEKRMQAIEDAWTGLALTFKPYKDTDAQVLASPADIVETLEEHQLNLQTMAGMGKFVDYFRDRVEEWQRTLGVVETVLKVWTNVQRTWSSLESIFLTSKDIRSQLPEDTKRFEGIDQAFRKMMEDVVTTPIVVQACNSPGREEELNDMSSKLELCQKALNEYLDTKKNVFPRFYFVSDTALLDILSNGNNPPRIMRHLGDCFLAVETLEFNEPDKKADGSMEIANTATALIAKDGERVSFSTMFQITGAVENWLGELLESIQETLKKVLDASLDSAANWELDRPRDRWITDYPAQLALLASQIYWTEETENALEELEGGDEDAVKRYLDLCNTRLDALIKMVQGQLTKEDRTKAIVMITVDVHARDVIQSLVDDKVEGPTQFSWQKQLRYYWQEDSQDVKMSICDFRSLYSYEYHGNQTRLVITPLTDRCYITLTMALRLMLGGAPAGPAGTGKTETTKDLARSLGVAVYVFNCSEQMNYQSLGNTFRGLSQTGAWGCFDEFNRIEIEVLSVVATQVKSILDAIRYLALPANRPTEFRQKPAGTPPCIVGYFDFMGDQIKLLPTVGFWITMNPGYAGRTELPENLKAQFRSCAMIRPDLKPICENMLMAEGFLKARTLSIKFVTLYQLSSELLSEQPHYDWGLRAVKSVLTVAGMLKRAEPMLDEEVILMRALRDFNTPKMVSQDIPIFLRLITDLFPGLELDKVVNDALSETCQKICKAKGLQPDDAFIQKVNEFNEILDVRHSVMLIGPDGCGKTSIWSTLAACNNDGAKKPVCVYETINPKSVTSNELYGFMNLSKDWKDGVLSIIMRNMSKNNMPYHKHQSFKWVVLDGDIDAVWIESMNTVMDDNKVLTLVSNERIPLSPSMRMIFEIDSLANATPATVSRAGILFINETDIGYTPYIESWIASRKHVRETSTLPGFFEKYIPTTFELLAANELTQIVPVSKICTVQSVCYILDGLLAQIDPEDASATADDVEALFVFSVLWAFCGSLTDDKKSSARSKFNNLWRDNFRKVLFPKDGHVLDYYYDLSSSEIVAWTGKVEEYVHGVGSFSSIFVPTVNSTRMTAVVDRLISRKRPVLLVGSAGTGKTQLLKEYLKGMDENHLYCTINMNYYTDSLALQTQLEAPVEKRSGKVFGPPAQKQLVYFVDDLNMPFKEEYGTQTPIALLRQYMDYKSWFDRGDPSLKKSILDVQIVSAMNPTSGSFTINARLQRHYVVLAALLPSAEDIYLIYSSILQAHLQVFPPGIQSLCKNMVEGTVEFHATMCEKFLPSAVKFHYNFNMREFSNVFEGLCKSTSDFYSKPLKFARLWKHECGRVFGDRLTTPSEFTRFLEMLTDCTKKYFEDVEQDLVHEEPLLFTSFCTQSMSDEYVYVDVTSWSQVRATLEEKLKQYNESNAIMNLVLFDEAIEHVCRISRILETPRGNALLVGVGGSGKQSLCRLAAYLRNLPIVTLPVTSDYTALDLKEHLKSLYSKAAVRPAEPLAFMLTDSMIVDEIFLVLINDLLSSGYIPDLFSSEEYDGIFGMLRNDAKSAGIPETRDNMMEFFLERVRSNLHVVMCFSPVGDTFRQRAQKFPGLCNCSSIDWFHPWPRTALVSVAAKFLEEVPVENEDIKLNVPDHMAEVHLSVEQASWKYLKTFNRYNYTTPKSYLELIYFFKDLYKKQRDTLQGSISRLAVGLETLQRTEKDVSELKLDLVKTMERVEEKKKGTDILLEQMGKQRGEAEKQGKVAAIEKEKCSKLAAEAERIEQTAENELKEAKPAMDAAKNAVDCLSKASLIELKSFAKPPAGVDKVTTCVLMMIKNERKNFSWDNAKKMMGKVDTFKEQLESYDARNIPDDVLGRVKPMLADKDMNVATMKKKSDAASNLCAWVISTVTYNEIYKKVKPLMEMLEKAQQEKAVAQAALDEIISIVTNLTDRLDQLQQSFLGATNEKAKVEAEAESCRARLSMAERLVFGLSSEKVRWTHEIENLKEKNISLIGDVLLSASFVSYAGAFNSTLRLDLWSKKWIDDMGGREIPVTNGIDPLDKLSNSAELAEWMNQGLPADRMSKENGAMIIACSRWPLIIDPQLQGIKWIRNMEESKFCATEGAHSSDENDLTQKKRVGTLVVVQTTQKNWLRKVVGAITNGSPCIIENLGEQIDSVLDPVLMRTVYRKGRNLFMLVGGVEVSYDESFRLYLQTKLSNPHYRPEIAAQTTLINFLVTEKGLQDQLLAKVVELEEPSLEETSAKLREDFNRYKIDLLELENQLLERLSNAPDDILSDVALIEGLEDTKRTVTEINAAVEKGKEMQKNIDLARNVYVPVAAEAAMLYFLLNELKQIDHMYQYSLDSFLVFFFKALKRAVKSEDIAQRVENLRGNLRIVVYTWITRGLFQRDIEILLAALVFQLVSRKVIGTESGYSAEAMDWLMRGGVDVEPDDENSIEWLPDNTWAACSSLSRMNGFETFTSDLVESAPRFREWFNLGNPETEKLPLDWRELDKSPFLKLLAVRALRPDRMSAALKKFIGDTLPGGNFFVDVDAQLNSYQILENLYEDSTSTTPLYFILSPGVDILSDVEKLAKKCGMEFGSNFFNISMGQGQDTIATEKIESGHAHGHWVMLNNVHLMPKWLVKLQMMLDAMVQEGSHENFRLFLSSDPAKSIPVSILDRSIKLTNEPPSGLKANLKRSFRSFSKGDFEELEQKTRGILFGLCHFHSVMIERKTFGPKGFNMQYPFSIQDLMASGVVLRNYMESAPAKMPWQDLRYLVGEIMYGGHIVNDFDRLLCNCYLDYFLRDELLDEMELYPYGSEFQQGQQAAALGFSFKAPAPTNYDLYLKYVEANMVGDSPIAFGLHPNAEIGFRTDQANHLFKTIMAIVPNSIEGGDDGEDSTPSNPQNIADAIVQDIQENFREVNFDIDDILSNIDEAGPFQNVFLQECEAMNLLVKHIRTTLEELGAGFRGEMTMSSDMEKLMTDLCSFNIPKAWQVRPFAFASLRALPSWLTNLIQRVTQLSEWSVSPMDPPRCTWISGLFNPQRFLTAVMQESARTNTLELDKLVINTTVLKREVEDIEAAARDGAFINGLFLEGARFDLGAGLLETSRPKELFFPMPVIQCKAVLSEKAETSNQFFCPVYKTQQRGPTFVFSANLRTKAPSAKWVLASVVLVMDIV